MIKKITSFMLAILMLVEIFPSSFVFAASDNSSSNNSKTGSIIETDSILDREVKNDSGDASSSIIKDGIIDRENELSEEKPIINNNDNREKNIEKSNDGKSDFNSKANEEKELNRDDELVLTPANLDKKDQNNSFKINEDIQNKEDIEKKAEEVPEIKKIEGTNLENEELLSKFYETRNFENNNSENNGIEGIYKVDLKDIHYREDRDGNWTYETGLNCYYNIPNTVNPGTEFSLDLPEELKCGGINNSDISLGIIKDQKGTGLINVYLNNNRVTFKLTNEGAEIIKNTPFGISGEFLIGLKENPEDLVKIDDLDNEDFSNFEIYKGISIDKKLIDKALEAGKTASLLEGNNSYNGEIIDKDEVKLSYISTFGDKENRLEDKFKLYGSRNFDAKTKYIYTYDTSLAKDGDDYIKSQAFEINRFNLLKKAEGKNSSKIKVRRENQEEIPYGIEIYDDENNRLYPGIWDEKVKLQKDGFDINLPTNGSDLPRFSFIYKTKIADLKEDTKTEVILADKLVAENDFFKNYKNISISQKLDSGREVENNLEEYNREYFTEKTPLKEKLATKTEVSLLSTKSSEGKDEIMDMIMMAREAGNLNLMASPSAQKSEEQIWLEGEIKKLGKYYGEMTPEEKAKLKNDFTQRYQSKYPNNVEAEFNKLVAEISKHDEQIWLEGQILKQGKPIRKFTNDERNTLKNAFIAKFSDLAHQTGTEENFNRFIVQINKEDAQNWINEKLLALKNQGKLNSTEISKVKDEFKAEFPDLNLNDLNWQESPEGEKTTYPYQLAYKSSQKLCYKDGLGLNYGAIDWTRDPQVWWDIEVDVSDLKNNPNIEYNYLNLALYAPRGQGLKEFEFGAGYNYDNIQFTRALALGNEFDAGSLKITKEQLQNATDNKIRIRAKASIEELHSGYSLGLRLNPDQNYIKKILDDFKAEFNKIPVIIKWMEGVEEAEKYASQPFNLIDARIIAKGIKSETKTENFYMDPTRTIVAETKGSKGYWILTDLLRIGEKPDEGIVTSTGEKKVQLKPDTSFDGPIVYVPLIDGGYKKVNSLSEAKNSNGEYFPGTLLFYKSGNQPVDKGKKIEINVDLQNKYTNQSSLIAQEGETTGGFKQLSVETKTQTDLSSEYRMYYETPFSSRVFRINKTFEIVVCINYGVPDPSTTESYETRLTRTEDPSGQLIFNSISNRNRGQSTLTQKVNNQYNVGDRINYYDPKIGTTEERVKDLLKRVYYYTDQFKAQYEKDTGKRLHRVYESQIVQLLVHNLTDNRDISSSVTPFLVDTTNPYTAGQYSDFYSRKILFGTLDAENRTTLFPQNIPDGEAEFGYQYKNINDSLHDYRIARMARMIREDVRKSYNSNDDWTKEKADSVDLVLYTHGSLNDYQQLIGAYVHRPVKVTKVDKDNKELVGAKFRTINRETGEIKEWTSKGTEDKVYLKEGKYKLEEIQAPEGYEPIKPVNFQIFKKEENARDAYYPSIRGDIHINDYVHNVLDIDGKAEIPVASDGTILMETDNELTVKIKNILDNLGELRFTKTDGHRPLDGAEFTLTKVDDNGQKILKDGKVVYEKISKGTKGEFVFDGLSEGTYILAETKVPKGFEKHKDLKVIVKKIDGQKKPVVIFEDQTIEESKNIVDVPIKTEIEFQKYDSIANTPLNGAKFRLYQKSGTGYSYDKTATSEVVGIKEQAPKEMHSKDGKITIITSWERGKDQKDTSPDTKVKRIYKLQVKDDYGNWQDVKSLEGTGSSSNIVFDGLDDNKLYKIFEEINGYYVKHETIKQDGELNLINKEVNEKLGTFKFDDLSAGEYILEEIVAPDGYKTPENTKWLVKVYLKDKYDGTGSPLTYDVKVLNYDKEGNAVEGIPIIENGENKLVYRIDNEAFVTSLKFKKYVENDQGGIDALPKDRLVDAEGKDVAFNLYNADYYGQKLPAKFGDTEIKPIQENITADANGDFNLTNLRTGMYYKLEEVNPPDGYVKDKTGFVLHVVSYGGPNLKVIIRDASNNAKVSPDNILEGVINRKPGLGKLRVRKTGSAIPPATGEIGIRRATFRLWFANENFIKTKDPKSGQDYIQKVTEGKAQTDIPDPSKQDENQGLAEFENLKPGYYVLEESRGPAGYERTTDTWNVTIFDDGKVTAEYVKGHGKNTDVSGRSRAPLKKNLELENLIRNEGRSTNYSGDFNEVSENGIYLYNNPLVTTREYSERLAYARAVNNNLRVPANNGGSILYDDDNIQVTFDKSQYETKNGKAQVTLELIGKGKKTKPNVLITLLVDRSMDFAENYGNNTTNSTQDNNINYFISQMAKKAKDKANLYFTLIEYDADASNIVVGAYNRSLMSLNEMEENSGFINYKLAEPGVERLPGNTIESNVVNYGPEIQLKNYLGALDIKKRINKGNDGSAHLLSLVNSERNKYFGDVNNKYVDGVKFNETYLFNFQNATGAPQKRGGSYYMDQVFTNLSSANYDGIYFTYQGNFREDNNLIKLYNQAMGNHSDINYRYYNGNVQFISPYGSANELGVFYQLDLLNSFLNDIDNGNVFRKTAEGQDAINQGYVSISPKDNIKLKLIRTTNKDGESAYVNNRDYNRYFEGLDTSTELGKWKFDLLRLVGINSTGSYQTGFNLGKGERIKLILEAEIINPTDDTPYDVLSLKVKPEKDKVEYEIDNIPTIKKLKEEEHPPAKDSYNAEISFVYTDYIKAGDQSTAKPIGEVGKMTLQRKDGSSWNDVDNYKDIPVGAEDKKLIKDLDPNGDYRIKYVLDENLRSNWTYPRGKIYDDSYDIENGKRVRKSDVDFYELNFSDAKAQGEGKAKLLKLEIQNGSVLKIFNINETGWRIPLRIKKCSESGYALDGSEFRVRKIKNGKQGEAYYNEPYDQISSATGLQGDNYFRELTPGIYELTETKVPKGFREDVKNQKWYFKVEANENVLPTEANYMKVIFDFAEEVEINGKTEKIYGLGHTDSIAKYKDYINLVPHEKDDGRSNPARPDAPYPTIDEIGVTNFNDTTTFEFQKLDETGRNSLSGAKFELVKVDEKNNPITGDEAYKKEVTSENEGGKVIFRGLTIGKYRLKEIEPPKGYQLNKEVYYIEVSIDANGKWITKYLKDKEDPNIVDSDRDGAIDAIKNKLLDTELKFEKVEADGSPNGKPVKYAKFKLEGIYKDGEKAGQVIPEGSNGYYFNEQEGEIDWNLLEVTKHIFTFKNLKEGRYKLTETDSSSYSKPRSWIFDIDEVNNGTETKLKIKLVDTDSMRNDIKFSDSLDTSDYHEIQEFKIINYKKVDLKLEKLDENGNPLKNSAFALKKTYAEPPKNLSGSYGIGIGEIIYSGDKNPIATEVRFSNQEIIRGDEAKDFGYYKQNSLLGLSETTFKDLSEGIYELDEIEAPTDYETTTYQRKWVLIVKKDSDANNNPTGLKIIHNKDFESQYLHQKYDDKPRFNVADDRTELIAMENKGQGDNETYKFGSKVKITNKKVTTEIEFTKVDSKNENEKLKDAEFILYKLSKDPDDSKIDNVYANTDYKRNSLKTISAIFSEDQGKFVIDDLNVGLYLLEEVKAPKDYSIADRKIAIQVKEYSILQNFPGFPIVTNSPKVTRFEIKLYEWEEKNGKGVLIKDEKDFKYLKVKNEKIDPATGYETLDTNNFKYKADFANKKIGFKFLKVFLEDKDKKTYSPVKRGKLTLKLEHIGKDNKVDKTLTKEFDLLDLNDTNQIKFIATKDFDGECILTEEKAPFGFGKTVNKYKIKIDAENEKSYLLEVLNEENKALVNDKNQKVTDTGVIIPSGGLDISLDANDVNFKIVNDRGVFPQSGGIGDLVFYGGGFALMICGAYMYLRKRKYAE
ncbi:prealbumin-like fold domain-containing protein [uncultured Peptoniphilus sp.]|uniref:prealbumin-like fold domain-containing protein n=1 Tax=uncultured Peptoniphilus sp. TaxID=254354 RepID=UPI002805066F|nr:prealbumin-like fold domain-containing protein [uncultured Peptoniphilus sp.]